MSKWQRTLNLLPEWKAAQDGTLPIHKMAGVIADRLAKLQPFGDADIDSTRDYLVEQFRDMSKDETANGDDIDEIIEELYNWANQRVGNGSFFDQKKVCWIKTF